MLFDFNRNSALLFFVFANSFLYAFLLLRRASVNGGRADKWLSFFLFLCALYITPWMVGFAGWYDTEPYRDLLFYVPFQQLFLIGPVIYFYTKSLLNPGFRFDKKKLLHFLPAILYLFYCCIVVVVDKFVLKRYYFLADGKDPDFDTWYQLTGLLSMTIYLILSIRHYRTYKKWIVQVVSYADTVMYRWVWNFLFAFLLMLVVRSGFLIVDLFTDLDYWSTWWYFLVFGMISYYIGVTGYANSVRSKLVFSFELLRHQAPLWIDQSAATVERSNVIEEDADASAEKLSPIKSALLDLIVGRKLYEDPELTLTMVAQKLSMTAASVSRAINQGFGSNFNDFINGFRVEAVKEMIAKDEHVRQTLLSIAFDCGFNSKATFNRAFKKATGLSPREYIRSSKN